MIHQLEQVARIILKAPSANFKKSTSGDFVLRLKEVKKGIFNVKPGNLSRSRKKPLDWLSRGGLHGDGEGCLRSSKALSSGFYLS